MKTESKYTIIATHTTDAKGNKIIVSETTLKAFGLSEKIIKQIKENESSVK